MKIKIQKYILSIIFFALGIFSLNAQVILIRELMLSFYGNELWLGLTLAFWLFSTGLGSILAIRFFKNEKLIEQGFKWSLFLVPILFFLSIVLSRFARVVLSSMGDTPELLPGVFYGFWAVFFLGLILGGQFALGGKLWQLLDRDKDSQGNISITRAYIIESGGFLFGALIFNFYLVSYSSLFNIAFISALFYWTVLIIISLATRKRNYFWPLMVIICLGLVSFLFVNFGSQFEQLTLGWRFPKEQMIVHQNSKFGTTAVTKINKQYNVYYNGRPMTTSESDYENELKAQIPMLLHNNPQEVLLLGNAFSGLCQEVLKYPVQNVDYVEQDEVLFNRSSKYFKDSVVHLLDKQRVDLIFLDSRYFLKQTEDKYDVIVISHTNPATLAENRLFTLEFFDLVNRHLEEDGIVIIVINATPNYTVPTQNKLLSIVFYSLSAVFTYVEVLPENEVIFLASQNEIKPDFLAINDKYKKFGLDNQYVFPQYLEWRLKSDRKEKLQSQLAGSEKIINTDLKPILYFEQLKIFWQKMGGRIKYVKWGLTAIVLLGLVFFIFNLGKSARRKKQQCLIILISAIPEFCLMAFEVLLILLYQTYQGFLNTQMAIIIAMILGGITLGSLIFRSLLAKINCWRLIKISYLIIIFSFALPLALVLWQRDIFEYQAIYYVLSILAGLAIGTKFPLVNKLYLANSDNLGAIYGFDLVGGALGALLSGIILLPVLGVVSSLGLLIILCLVALVTFSAFIKI